jgi:chemotaxis protein CheX
MASAIDSSGVTSTNEWSAALGRAAVDVFSMMVGVSVVPAQDQSPALQADVTGTVGIAGAFSAVFSLRCSTQAAISIASQMLGIPPQEAGAQQRDAVGEVCNIIAGDFKAKVGLGDQCMLSVPSVITGRDYRLHSPGNRERIELQLNYGDEKIEIALDIRR